MNFPFFATLKELIITGRKMIELEIADKLYQFHIFPMDAVRKELGVWITASLKSGYRPKWWERKKGRSGNSQHTFEDEWTNGSGAVDWTCEDFEIHRYRFLDLIIERTHYTRIAVYEGFIHCDYKKTPSGKREIYKSNAKSEWVLEKIIDN